ncbi:hypothetical protein PHLGIDRAFT_161197 [Phlebiopsis gigantea 11061_1 CR5-6]|uniref:G protein-coupled receptor n=1 Tax=Phlebiopsis gigantea (strain 11061_1 CR5-6) TaxID=745531 RepID=A0A0C3RVJ0_PHLG1|nr:hypothetical protein PHLGIDRAFT_161197 [Phlebiopsis gigantea 11061_1 CR5-6]
MVVLDTAMFFIDVNNAVKEVSYTLTSSSDLDLADRYARIAFLPYTTQAALYAFICNLGDVVVVWRVHVFYTTSHHRWIMALPIALLFGGFAMSGILSYCAGYSVMTDAALIGCNFAQPLCRKAQFTSYCVTLVTTGVATLMICYKAWQYRRTVGKLLCLHEHSQNSRVERVMQIVMESGVLYFLFFLHTVLEDSTALNTLEFSTPGLVFASTIWICMTSHIVSIYPVVVLIFVHTTYSSSAESSGGFTSASPRCAAVDGRPLEVRVRTTVDMCGETIPLGGVARKGKRFEVEGEGGSLV